MAVYTRRVQTILTDDQFRELSRLARKRHAPISSLVREAIEQVYFGSEGGVERRQAALENLLGLNAPVSEWNAMEAEIIQGVLES